VFGSLSWNATDRLKASASLRASTVTKDIVGDAHYGVNTGPYTGFVQDPPVPEQLAGAILQRPPGESQNLSQTERALMPSARIQYQISPGAMGYFSYSRGFKAGGFDGQSLTLTNFEYGPEHVNAYELGLKSTWFDDTVLLNVDVFRSDYTGLQVESAVYQPQLNGYVVYVANAAISRSQGLEFEGQWAVSKNFRLSANVTYLESYYVNYPGAAAPDLQSYCGTLTQPALSATPQCAAFSFPVPTYTNLAGQPTLYSPKWSASAAARYIVPLPGDFKFSSQLSPYYTSSYNPDAGGLYRPLGNYVRLDGRLTLETPDGRWALDVIGKNLTDRVILTTLNTKEEPRNVAVQVRFHW
jgi:outer membrane receptor protein involved in Fe transport